MNTVILFLQKRNINILKDVKKQLHNGILYRTSHWTKQNEPGWLKLSHLNQIRKSNSEEKDKISFWKPVLYQKADSVVSYQLLQHRREIDDLQEQVSFLTVNVYPILRNYSDKTKRNR